MNKRIRMKKRAIRLVGRSKPFYFFLKSMDIILQNIKKYFYTISKGLERLYYENH